MKIEEIEPKIYKVTQDNDIQFKITNVKIEIQSHTENDFEAARKLAMEKYSESIKILSDK